MAGTALDGAVTNAREENPVPHGRSLLVPLCQRAAENPLDPLTRGGPHVKAEHNAQHSQRAGSRADLADQISVQVLELGGLVGGRVCRAGRRHARGGGARGGQHDLASLEKDSSTIDLWGDLVT
eukprot:4449735-Prymnesium_polylepis.1